MIFRGIRRSDRPLSDLGEARTLDPLIKSQLLYQLSYEVIASETFQHQTFRFSNLCLSAFLNCDAKVRRFFRPTKHFPKKIQLNLNFYQFRPIINLFHSRQCHIHCHKPAKCAKVAMRMKATRYVLTRPTAATETATATNIWRKTHQNPLRSPHLQDIATRFSQKVSM